MNLHKMVKRKESCFPTKFKYCINIAYRDSYPSTFCGRYMAICMFLFYRALDRYATPAPPSRCGVFITYSLHRGNIMMFNRHWNELHRFMYSLGKNLPARRRWLFCCSESYYEQSFLSVLLFFKQLLCVRFLSASDDMFPRNSPSPPLPPPRPHPMCSGCYNFNTSVCWWKCIVIWRHVFPKFFRMVVLLFCSFSNPFWFCHLKIKPLSRTWCEPLLLDDIILWAGSNLMLPMIYK